LDIFSTGEEGETPIFYFNDGNGDFTAHKFLINSLESLSSLKFVDLDNDGDDDILFSTLRNKVSWIEKIGDRNYNPNNLPITNNIANYFSIVGGDIDNDNDIDIIASFGDRIAWYENLGGEQYSSFNLIDLKETKNLTLLDLDGDNNLDVLCLLEKENKAAWYKNIDSGKSFSEQAITQNIYAINEIVSKDGDSDVIISKEIDAREYQQIVLYKNKEGDFSESKVLVDSISFLLDFIIDDFNNDNEFDILTTQLVFDNRSFINVLYENIGNDSFKISENKDNSFLGARNIVSSDLDEDGDLDLLTNIVDSTFNSSLGWYKNDGLGNFELNQIIEKDLVTNSPNLLVDTDNDGDLDLIRRIWQDSFVTALYENEGLGIFSEPKIINRRRSFNSFKAEDLNQDGSIDLLVGTGGADPRIIWYENLLNNTTSTNNFYLNNIPQIYPNPFDNLITIEQEIFEASNLPTLSLIFIKSPMPTGK